MVCKSIAVVVAAAVMAGILPLPQACSAEEKEGLLVKGEGIAITRADVDALKARVQTYLQTTDTEHCRALLRMTLFAREARARKLDEDPDFKARIEYIVLQELFNLYVRSVLSAYPLSEEVVESYYFSHQDEFQGKDGNITPLNDSVRESIRNKIMNLKRSEIIRDELDQLMEKYRVKIIDPVCDRKEGAP
jgi:hypothetical protein